MKKFDYNEPLFNIVKTSAQDILTVSDGSGSGSSGNIPTDNTTPKINI